MTYRDRLTFRRQRHFNAEFTIRDTNNGYFLQKVIIEWSILRLPMFVGTGATPHTTEICILSSLCSVGDAYVRRCMSFHMINSPNFKPHRLTQ